MEPKQSDQLPPLINVPHGREVTLAVLKYFEFDPCAART